MSKRKLTKKQQEEIAREAQRALNSGTYNAWMITLRLHETLSLLTRIFNSEEDAAEHPITQLHMGNLIQRIGFGSFNADAFKQAYVKVLELANGCPEQTHPSDKNEIGRYPNSGERKLHGRVYCSHFSCGNELHMQDHYYSATSHYSVPGGGEGVSFSYLCDQHGEAAIAAKQAELAQRQELAEKQAQAIMEVLG